MKYHCEKLAHNWKELKELSDITITAQFLAQFLFPLTFNMTK